MKYVYRNITIVEYDEEKKVCTFPDGDVFVNDTIKVAHITHVRLLQEDHMHLAEFHLKIAKHMAGHDVDLTDIVVN